MDLIIFGLNHRTAPLAMREKWAFSECEARETLARAKELVVGSENLILSTCNRTEIYSLIPGSKDNGGGKSLESLLDFLHRLKNSPREQDTPHFYNLHGQKAVEHLFRLAAGLDSMIVGEGQILRQLRDAFELARSTGTIGNMFHKLFPAALKAGKRIRTETGISEGCITHGQAAVRIARNRIGDLAGKTVLLIGSGKVMHLATQALRDFGIARVLVVNRTPEHACVLADELGGEAFSLESLPALLQSADVIISCTGSTEPLVKAEALAAARSHRAPLVIIDLAVPRDFDPACGEVPGVHLHNIDHLEEVVRTNIDGRLTEVPRAEQLVQEELKAFFGHLNYIYLDPVIQHLIQRFEIIRATEVKRHLDRIPPEHHAAVEALTTSMVKKILHFPIEKLKGLRDDAGLSPVEVAFLRRLFLSDAKPPQGPPGVPGAPPGVIPGSIPGAIPDSIPDAHPARTPGPVHPDRKPR
jgi:glutamyl-tRNA reductase